MPLVILTVPATAANVNRAMTPMPVQWTRCSGMKSNSFNEVALCGPWEEYMKAAKKAARARATNVPMTGRVHMVRARRVRS